MDWIDDTLDALAAATAWGYHAGAPSATEPVALSALALIAHRRDTAARPLLEWLSAHRNADGSLGVTAAQNSPCWPTSLAMLAWLYADRQSRQSTYADMIQAAADWTLQIKGVPIEGGNEMGHDSSLIGWPWVESTHSWIEPTAQHVLALRAVGLGDHARTREALRLLVDRLLPEGGCNYGNTIVLGQTLRPHLEPSGVCLMALSDQPDADGRIGKSLVYLREALNQRTATASLCYGLLGLAAHDSLPADSDQALALAARRTRERDSAPYKLALLALAALGAKCPLITLPRNSS
jgi:hypothetical protein